MEDQTEKSKIQQLKTIIKNSRNLCVFTGAGISCASGIPDFRSADGLYNQDFSGKYSPEEMISHSFFETNTELFFRFYKEKMLYPLAKPNAAHRYFASLEKPERAVSVVTQNIDGLHTAAGSSRVYELHGSALRNYCLQCHRLYTSDEIAAMPGIPHCREDGAIIKPDVVLYEEPLDARVVNGAVGAIAQADTMIVVGTSLAVYPAASYIGYFAGEHLIVINKSETSYDQRAELVFNQDIISVVEQLKK